MCVSVGVQYASYFVCGSSLSCCYIASHSDLISYTIGSIDIPLKQYRHYTVKVV